MIDYEYFEQNTSDQVNENWYADPCKVAECPSEPKRRIVRQPQFYAWFVRIALEIEVKAYPRLRR